MTPLVDLRDHGVFQRLVAKAAQQRRQLFGQRAAIRAFRQMRFDARDPPAGKSPPAYSAISVSNSNNS
jgi:hypothetical protein